MAKYEKYAEYKDSNAQWLGDVPSHWGVEYSKWLFKERNVKATLQDEMLTASQKYGVIPQKMFMELEQQKVVQVFSGHDILKKAETNDFVISMRSFQGGIEFSEYSGAVSSAYVPLEPRSDLSLSYYKYLFKSVPYIQALQTTTNLVRDGQALRYGNFIQVRIPLVPFNEAEKIGQFLDHETAKIDTLITKQEKLIELLKEKRQAVISHAVTKGLNPNVPMKDSGVEWLGEVPEHWEIPKMLYITTRIGDGLHSTPIYQDGTGYYFINGNNLVDGKIVIGDTAKEVPESEFIKHQVTLDKSTVLLSINGTIGKVALYNNESVILGKSAAYINCHSELLPSYLASYLITSEAQKYYDLEVTGTTIFNLSLNSIRNMRVPLPSIDEQTVIVQFITEQCLRYGSLIQSADKQNKLLKERRTALISAAVTGKIDVRHHASRPTGNDKNQTEVI